MRMKTNFISLQIKSICEKQASSQTVVLETCRQRRHLGSDRMEQFTQREIKARLRELSYRIIDWTVRWQGRGRTDLNRKSAWLVECDIQLILGQWHNSNFENLHHFIPQMVDHLHGDAAGLGLVERA